jgi:hypothetical protein
MCSHLPPISEQGSEKPILILLSGWAGSGKDAVAATLTSHFGFQRFAFADPLKEAVAAATGFPAAMFERPYKDRPLGPSDSRTPRDLLIAHADAARARDPDIYSRAILEAIRASGTRRAVISDWRYRREGVVVSEPLAAEGWHIQRIRIRRPGVFPSAAPIEHDLDTVEMDAWIENDGSLADLSKKVTTWVTGVTGDVPSTTTEE